MIPEAILNKIGRNLYQVKNHPLFVVKEKIYDALPEFETIEGLDPYVSIHDNFDSLQDPIESVSCFERFAFFKDAKTLLRTRTAAHLTSSARGGYDKFLICGDVYRTNVSDAFSLSAFHQITGFCLLNNKQRIPMIPGLHLRRELIEMIGSICEGFKHRRIRYRIIDEHNRKDIFCPYTTNSCELQLERVSPLTGVVNWMTVLKAGTVHPEVMNLSGLSGKMAWTFTAGLERLAMVFFDIPSIENIDKTTVHRVATANGLRHTAIVPQKRKAATEGYQIHKDFSFWVPEKFNESDMFSLVYEEAEDFISEIRYTGDFYNAHLRKSRRFYKLIFNNSSLKNNDINEIYRNLKDKVLKKFSIVIS